MEIRRFAERQRFSPDKMQKVSLFESERFFCDLYCLLPGQSQRRHAHPGSDKVYAVLEGRARATVGSETAEVAAGEAVHAPAGLEHGIENAADAPLVVLVFLAPPPHGGG